MDNNVKNQIATNIKENKFLYGSIVLVLLVALMVLFGYMGGYRFQENFTVGKLGSLTLEAALPGTNIIIDKNQKIVTTKDNEVVDVSLSPRNHTVIISRDGYFPWKKDFTMPSKGNVKLSPVFVSVNPSGVIITKKDADFWKIRNKIITDALPTIASPRISKDGTAKLWIENNAVMVEITPSINSGQATTTKKVIQPEPAIKNLYFYKDRDDVIIFSVANSVFAIEVDKDGTQNFLPIYKGTDPSFIEGDSNFIYVLDGETLMQVVI